MKLLGLLRSIIVATGFTTAQNWTHVPTTGMEYKLIAWTDGQESKHTTLQDYCTPSLNFRPGSADVARKVIDKFKDQFNYSCRIWLGIFCKGVWNDWRDRFGNVVTTPMWVEGQPQRTSLRAFIFLNNKNDSNIHWSSTATFNPLLRDYFICQRAYTNTTTTTTTTTTTIATTPTPALTTAPATTEPTIGRLEIQINGQSYNGSDIKVPVTNGERVTMTCVESIGRENANGILTCDGFTYQNPLTITRNMSRKVCTCKGTMGSVTSKTSIQLIVYEPPRISIHQPGRADILNRTLNSGKIEVKCRKPLGKRHKAVELSLTCAENIQRTVFSEDGDVSLRLKVPSEKDKRWCNCTARWNDYGNHITTKKRVKLDQACDCGIHKCRQDQGGYSCQCQTGYENNGSKVCQDIDECLRPGSKPCGDHTCVNEPGRYQCQCDGDDNIRGMICLAKIMAHNHENNEKIRESNGRMELVLPENPFVRSAFFGLSIWIILFLCYNAVMMVDTVMVSVHRYATTERCGMNNIYLRRNNSFDTPEFFIEVEDADDTTISDDDDEIDEQDTSSMTSSSSSWSSSSSSSSTEVNSYSEVGMSGI